MDADRRTVARAQEISQGSAGTSWNLYDQDGDLIGWTLDVPPRSITQREAFSCRTGDVVPVRYTPSTQYRFLRRQ